MENVPQIVEETGISGDYWNEYFGKTMAIEMKRMDYVVEGIREFPIQKYEQRFSPKEYNNVINPKNELGVKRLNELSDLVNENFNDLSKFVLKDFKEIVNEVYNLIFYDLERKFYEIDE